MDSLSKSENAEKEKASDYLERMKQQGFLFHGTSKSGLEKLSPSYTFDPKSKTNTDTAVFATDNIGWAIIFGIYGGHKGWSTHVSKGDVTAKIPKKDKELVESTQGTVFVLPPDSFTGSEDGQFKSHKQVTPINKVTVRLQDFYELGGKIIWT